MAKVSMRDIVVLLPGITGSILRKNGRDVWNISRQAIWSAVTTLGESLQDLELRMPDPSLAEMERIEGKEISHAHFRTATDGNSTDYVWQICGTRSSPLWAYS